MNINTHQRLLALLALILFAPAPTVGVLLALSSQQGKTGAFLWAMAKIWLFVLPAFWYLFIQKQKVSLSPPRKGGVGVGLLVGVLMFFVIWLAFCFLGERAISPDEIRLRAQQFGLNKPFVYLLASLYWILINSLLEEYIFRFFLYRQIEIVLGKWQLLAVLLAGLLFTVHHSVVLSAYLPAFQNLLASLGVFSAGVIWSAMYARYRSIWIPFISHLWADIGVFSVGAYLIFIA